MITAFLLFVAVASAAQFEFSDFKIPPDFDGFGASVTLCTKLNKWEQKFFKSSKGKISKSLELSFVSKQFRQKLDYVSIPLKCYGYYKDFVEFTYQDFKDPELKNVKTCSKYYLEEEPKEFQSDRYEDGRCVRIIIYSLPLPEEYADGESQSLLSAKDGRTRGIMEGLPSKQDLKVFQYDQPREFTWTNFKNAIKKASVKESSDDENKLTAEQVHEIAEEVRQNLSQESFQELLKESKDNLTGEEFNVMAKIAEEVRKENEAENANPLSEEESDSVLQLETPVEEKRTNEELLEDSEVQLEDRIPIQVSKSGFF